METREFLYKGKRLVYRTKGIGPVVVLLHGFGEDGTIWRKQFDLFPDHQLIIPDLPGSGGSEAIDDMSMEGLAEAIAALMAPSILQEGSGQAQSSPVGDAALSTESLQSKGRSEAVDNLSVGGRGTLIGHSMGGYITLAFAEKYPERLNAFGLFHSTALADSGEKKDTRRKGIQTMKEKGAQEFLKTFVPNLYGPVTKGKRPQLIEEHLASVYNVDSTAYVAYFEAMMNRPDRTAVLQNAKVPVLFVMGRHDSAVPLQDSLKQCRLPQTAYIHLLENSGHCGMVEEAEQAAKVLSEFITTVDTLAYT